MKSSGSRLVLFSALAVTIMAGNPSGSQEERREGITRLLVTKSVLEEYVTYRLSQLVEEENLTEEEAEELSFIRENMNNLPELANYYGMRIKEARPKEMLARKEPPVSDIQEEPPRESPRVDTADADSLKLPGEKPPREDALTETFQLEQTSFGSESSRPVGEGHGPKGVQEHRTAEDWNGKEEVPFSRGISSTALPSEKPVIASKVRGHSTSHNGTPDMTGTSNGQENLSEQHLPPSLKARTSLTKTTAQIGEPSPSPPSIGEEVDELLINYVKKYNTKDVKGLLSLLSPKCFQNRKYGFEEIRNMYSHFFDQSQELRYRLEGVDIKVYEEGGLVFGLYYFDVAEVKARYELVQILKKGGKPRVWRGDISWIMVREDEDLRILSIIYRHEKSS